jgi:uncharacterized phage protein (TIGR02218 family)
MKTASGGLIALLGSGNEFFMADLLTITLVTGTVLRYTNGDTDLVSGGNTFSSSGLIFERSNIKLTTGLTVDAMTLKLFADANSMLSGIPAMQFIRNGGLDGARVELDRIFMPSWGDTSLGPLWMFSGRVSEVPMLSRYACELKVASDLELLAVPFPRNLYQPGCTNSLYDSGCGVARATYTSSLTAASGSTVNQLNFTSAQATGYFDLGVVTFTGGQNAGASRTVKAYTNGSPSNCTFALPLPYAPQAGDTFTIYPGCDKTFSGTNGCPKFSNTARYRGFPFIPVPETTR